MKSLKILLLLLIGACTTVSAQDSQKDDSMQALNFLTGTWNGEGWIQSREGRIDLISAEYVKSKLKGNAILVEGIHREKNALGEAGEILFEALALITPSEEGNYHWRSATSRGRGGNFTAEVVGEKAMQWGKEGSFRYKIKIDEQGRWHEIGESTRDGGKTWHQFFEMTLEKQE